MYLLHYYHIDIHIIGKHTYKGAFIKYRPMERDPLDIIVEHDPRGHQDLGETVNVDTVLFVSLELYTAFLEHVYGVLCVHVITAYEERDSEARYEARYEAWI